MRRWQSDDIGTCVDSARRGRKFFDRALKQPQNGFKFSDADRRDRQPAATL